MTKIILRLQAAYDVLFSPYFICASSTPHGYRLRAIKDESAYSDADAMALVRKFHDGHHPATISTPNTK